MLDRDLAELYGVETKVLKQAVRRNINRFPNDFMFEMTKDEFTRWRSQFVTSREGGKDCAVHLSASQNKEQLCLHAFLTAKELLR